MVPVCRGPRSDHRDSGHCGKVPEKTLRGPFFTTKKWTFVFSSRVLKFLKFVQSFVECKVSLSDGTVLICYKGALFLTGRLW